MIPVGYRYQQLMTLGCWFKIDLFSLKKLALKGWKLVGLVFCLVGVWLVGCFLFVLFGEF